MWLPWVSIITLHDTFVWLVFPNNCHLFSHKVIKIISFFT